MAPMSDRGQLLLPVLAVLFLFGMFWVVYVRWCLRQYQQMRMDAAADLVALSGAREQARILNEMATLQTLQNPLVARMKGYALSSIDRKPQFDALNTALRVLELTSRARIYAALNQIARWNGSNRPVIPGDWIRLSNPASIRLDPQRLKVVYVIPGAPPLVQVYPAGYYTRQWAPRTIKAQPDHESAWRVCRDSICGQGHAALCLDVDLSDPLQNGGFPPPSASLWREIGFQCFYPQFNARLVPKR